MAPPYSQNKWQRKRQQILQLLLLLVSFRCNSSEFADDNENHGNWKGFQGRTETACKIITTVPINGWTQGTGTKELAFCTRLRMLMVDPMVISSTLDSLSVFPSSPSLKNEGWTMCEDVRWGGQTWMSKLTLILSISLFIIIINPSKDLPSPLSWIFLSFATVLNEGGRHSERSDL